MKTCSDGPKVLSLGKCPPISILINPAQRIYAACDMFNASLFEPCGLSQIFSMRYGTVPIVRKQAG